jgi:5-methylcytosine-specific restriction endonuclease McrA
MKTCSVDGCNEKHVAKGYCQGHYDLLARMYDKESKKKYNKRFRSTEKGKDINKKSSKKYRAQKRNLTVETFSPKEIFERDGYTCCICGLSINPLLNYPDPFSASLEHILPISKNGPHTKENCSSSHLKCNLRKGAKLISGSFEGASI